MTLENNYDIYNSNYDFVNSINELKQVSNKLFCTFTPLPQLDTLVSDITEKYAILYNKIFILQIKGYNEVVATYNVEQGNIKDIIENTILVHRKKESNSLYTINALNELIRSLNNGKLDNKFPIPWSNYQNTILLTQQNELKKLETKIYKIINL